MPTASSPISWSKDLFSPVSTSQTKQELETRPTILIVRHHQDVLRTAQTVYFLKDGNIAASGPLESIQSKQLWSEQQTVGMPSVQVRMKSADLVEPRGIEPLTS